MSFLNKKSFSTNEIERLKKYREKIIQNVMEFSKEEIIDFRKLIYKALKEHPENTGFYILTILAILIQNRR
ncbi:MAG: hypothetical protein QW156_04630 [Candidatus Aenigmatarchaeota archaeon]